MSEPHGARTADPGAEETLTDEEVETHSLASTPSPSLEDDADAGDADDSADDSGDDSDTADTGDDSDTADTGDDPGDDSGDSDS